jgi:hypothetical protein
MRGGVVHPDANQALEMCRGGVTGVEEAEVKGLGPLDQMVHKVSRC